MGKIKAGTKPITVGVLRTKCPKCGTECNGQISLWTNPDATEAVSQETESSE